jgi:hypothetical protein
MDSVVPSDPSIDTTPKPGDVTLCLFCGEWCVFDVHLMLRKPTDDELVEIGLDPDFRVARQAWFFVIKSGRNDDGR